jgi:hypothetical protein
MRVVKAGTKGGPHDDVSICRRVDDIGISVFHRPGRSYRPKTSSLNRVRDGSIPSGEQAVEQACLIELVLSLWRQIPTAPVGTRGTEVSGDH